MEVAALSLLSLWGALGLCSGHHVSTGPIDMLAHAAMNLQDTLTCGAYDCKCAYMQRDCCCVANQVNALENSTLIRVLGLIHDVWELDTQTKALTKENHIAFSATATFESFGPFTTNVPIPYTLIGFNDGNGYNPALGIFTAPRAGVYSFSYTVYSKLKYMGARFYLMVQLRMNGETIASTWEDNREDLDDSATQVVMLRLKRGCQVYMEIMAGRKISGSLPHQNIFSGYLVYPTEEQS